jgi:hypothetical protein
LLSHVKDFLDSRAIGGVAMGATLSKRSVATIPAAQAPTRRKRRRTPSFQKTLRT